ncbi:hypothetical protein LP421_18955 [Rhizobium sp. RCAM05350]|nr:hypothetical protein LP421_18955 [Rhizobium sp. RCAM05350]
MTDKTSEGSSSGDLPSLEEMLKSVKVEPEGVNDLQVDYEDRFRIRSIEAQKAYTHLLGLQAHYSHKRKWSWFLMLAMAFMLIFQSYLLYKVGTGSWDFTAYRWLLPLLLVQNLGQIIGLAVIVVKSLFTNLDPP